MPIDEVVEARATPRFTREDVEQITGWARANGFGNRSFTEQVRLAALHGSKDYSPHPVDATAAPLDETGGAK